MMCKETVPHAGPNYEPSSQRRRTEDEFEEEDEDDAGSKNTLSLFREEE